MSQTGPKARRGSTQSEVGNLSGRGGRDTPVRPIRVTVDLDPGDYDTLRDFAHAERMTHADVLRALIGLLGEPRVAQQVRKYGTQ